jgi:hypothetical protein
MYLILKLTEAKGSASIILAIRFPAPLLVLVRSFDVDSKQESLHNDVISSTSNSASISLEANRTNIIFYSTWESSMKRGVSRVIVDL